MSPLISRLYVCRETYNVALQCICNAGKWEMPWVAFPLKFNAFTMVIDWSSLIDWASRLVDCWGTRRKQWSSQRNAGRNLIEALGNWPVLNQSTRNPNLNMRDSYSIQPNFCRVQIQHGCMQQPTLKKHQYYYLLHFRRKLLVEAVGCYKRSVCAISRVTRFN